MCNRACDVAASQFLDHKPAQVNDLEIAMIADEKLHETALHFEDYAQFGNITWPRQ